jgi:hypothetical protein
LIIAALTEPGMRAGTIEFDFTAIVQSVMNNLSPTGVFARLGAYTFLSSAQVGDSVSGSFIFNLDTLAYDPAGEFISGGYPYGTGFGSAPFVIGTTSVTDGSHTLSSTSPDVWQIANCFLVHRHNLFGRLHWVRSERDRHGKFQFQLLLAAQWRGVSGEFPFCIGASGSAPRSISSPMVCATCSAGSIAIVKKIHAAAFRLRSD